MKLKILLSAFFIVLISFESFSQITNQQWSEDMDELIEKLEKHHPNPYRHISKDAFYKQIDHIKQNLNHSSEKEIHIKLMKLVSALRDGHTEVRPNNSAGFDHWLPLSIYKFPDGFYVVSGLEKYKDIIGKKILQFDNTPASEVFELTADLLPSDNELGRSWNTFYMCSMEALQSLNISKSNTEISLQVESLDGKKSTHKVKAEILPNNVHEYRFWGEMYGPENDGIYPQYQMAYNNLNLKKWIKTPLEDKQDMPLFLRSRRGYWYDYLEKENAMYVALCYTTSSGRNGHKSFTAFHDEVFKMAEEKTVDKFILDLRFNSGGDGSVVIPFIHKFIRSDHVNRKGRLFTLTGRKTYSAAQMIYAEMLKHTNTLLVGEPAGAPLNGYGDPMHYTLKNSKMHLQVSTAYWQMGHPNDTSWVQKIDIPAVFNSQEYFSGKDPAIEYILLLEDKFSSLPELLRSKEVDLVRKEYQMRKITFGKYDWWVPFSEREMRYAARELYDQGNTEAGEFGFEMLTSEFPHSWRAWRDYAKRLINKGEKEKAKDCIQKGLKANEGSVDLKNLLAKIK